MRARDLVAFLGALLSSACSSLAPAPGVEGACTSAPAACPPGAPGYAAVVARIVHDECASCHSPGGTAADRPLTTLTQVQTYAGPSLDQTAACNMPPGGGAMPPADREALLAWLVCGAKDD